MGLFVTDLQRLGFLLKADAALLTSTSFGRMPPAQAKGPFRLSSFTKRSTLWFESSLRYSPVYSLELALTSTVTSLSEVARRRTTV